MSITGDDIVGLAKAWLDCVMVRQEPPSAQQKFFLHRDPILFLLRGEDMTLQQNYELHRKLTDEKHWSVGWDVTQLCDKPERARAVGAFYWEARVRGRPAGELIKAYCFQDWIVQRMPSGELKFVVYINTDHSFLPGSATVDL